MDRNFLGFLRKSAIYAILAPKDPEQTDMLLRLKQLKATKEIVDVEHAVGLLGLCRIDALDPGVTVRRHHQHRERLLRQIDVVDVAATAGEETLILHPADGLPYTKFADDCVHGVPRTGLMMMSSPARAPAVPGYLSRNPMEVQAGWGCQSVIGSVPPLGEPDAKEA